MYYVCSTIVFEYIDRYPAGDLERKNIQKCIIKT